MDDYFDQFFFYISKFVIIIPLVIIFAVLVIKFNQDNTKLLFNKTILSPTPTIQSKNTIINLVNQTSTLAARIDLKGPIMCNYNYKDSSISAYIKDKKILLDIVGKKEINHALVIGDCYYQWKQGVYTGKKTCGISQLLSLMEMASQFNFVNLGDILKFIPNKGGLDTLGEINIEEIIGSCKKEKVDDRVFEIPKMPWL